MGCSLPVKVVVVVVVVVVVGPVYSVVDSGGRVVKSVGGVNGPSLSTCEYEQNKG